MRRASRVSYNTPMAWLLLIAALLIGLNFLFVLMEYALIRVRSSRVEVLARRGLPGAASVQEILSRLDRYLAAIQVGLTMIALALGWVGEPALAHWLNGVLSGLPWRLAPGATLGLSFVLGLALLSWAHIVFGELLPRSIGLQKAEPVALAGAPALKAFALVLRVPVAFISFCSLSLLRLIGLKPAAGADSVVSEEEMRIVLGETQERGSLPLERLLLLENLLDLGSAKVSEAMVPREKIVALSLSKPWQENLALMRARRFSRYPLCEDGLDSVIGMVHVKDLLLKENPAGSFDLRALRRDVAEVGEGEGLEKLLKSFPDKGIHMAVVRDAQARVSGLLTLEDIVEEVIGEIHDEFDLKEAWSLMDVLVTSCVAVGLAAADRRSAIAQLMAGLKSACPELKEDEAFHAVWERERKFSSGVGRGVAVPHARLMNLPRALVAVGRFAKPVPFPSPDDVPVRLVFLILTPASAPVVQLKVLSRIAAVVMHENLRRKLLRAKTSEALLEILRTADTMLAA